MKKNTHNALGLQREIEKRWQGREREGETETKGEGKRD